MNNLEEIEKAVSDLSWEDSVRFRLWYETMLRERHIEKSLKADFLTDRSTDHAETYQNSKMTEALNRIYDTESSDMDPCLMKLQIKSMKKNDDSSW
jgi:hypothetical protein